MLKRKDPVLLNDSWITGNEMGQVANQMLIEVIGKISSKLKERKQANQKEQNKQKNKCEKQQ